MWGVGRRVVGIGFGVQGLGSRVQYPGCVPLLLEEESEMRRHASPAHVGVGVKRRTSLIRNSATLGPSLRDWGVEGLGIEDVGCGVCGVCEVHRCGVWGDSSTSVWGMGYG